MTRLRFSPMRDRRLWSSSKGRRCRWWSIAMSATVRLVRRRFACTAAGVRYAVWIWPAAMAKSAKGFIHIHHLIPLSGIKQDYRLNPETDLIPVCPNCHAMLHRRDPPFTPEELKARLRPRDRDIRQHRFNYITHRKCPTPPLPAAWGQLSYLSWASSPASQLYAAPIAANLSPSSTLILELIKLSLSAVPGVVYRRQADERAGKEPAVALQHTNIGQPAHPVVTDPGERHAIEAVFIAVGLLADLGPNQTYSTPSGTLMALSFSTTCISWRLFSRLR